MGYRAMRNATLEFGVVNIGVKIIKATDDHDLGFHEYHATNGCMGRMGRKNYCKECNAVAVDDIVKGMDYDGKVAVFSDEERRSLNDERSGAISIEQFSPADQIDPMYWEGMYWLAPTGKSGGFQYLRHALINRGEVAVAKYVMSTRESVCIVRPDPNSNALMLHTLRWHDEIRNPAELGIPVVELKQAEIDMMDLVMDSRADDFDPTVFVDGYTERLREVAAAKVSGGSYTPAAAVDLDSEPEDVSDLLAKLEASVKKPAPRKAAMGRHPAKGVAKKAPAKKAPAKRAPRKAS